MRDTYVNFQDSKREIDDVHSILWVLQTNDENHVIKLACRAIAIRLDELLNLMPSADPDIRKILGKKVNDLAAMSKVLRELYVEPVVK